MNVSEMYARVLESRFHLERVIYLQAQNLVQRAVVIMKSQKECKICSPT